jgi:hypothetical protein
VASKNVVYYTVVRWIPPSPLGLVGNRWVIDHRCDICYQQVPTDQLLAHTKNHTEAGIIAERPDNGRVC